MASLSWTEKRQLEQLFGMGGGYVLDFTNNSFAAFVEPSVGRNIYDAKYSQDHSGSKANQLPWQATRSVSPEEPSRMCIVERTKRGVDRHRRGAQ